MRMRSSSIDRCAERIAVVPFGQCRSRRFGPMLNRSQVRRYQEGGDVDDDTDVVDPADQDVVQVAQAEQEPDDDGEEERDRGLGYQLAALPQPIAPIDEPYDVAAAPRQDLAPPPPGAPPPVDPNTVQWQRYTPSPDQTQPTQATQQPPSDQTQYTPGVPYTYVPKYHPGAPYLTRDGMPLYSLEQSQPPGSKWRSSDEDWQEYLRGYVLNPNYDLSIQRRARPDAAFINRWGTPLFSLAEPRIGKSNPEEWDYFIKGWVFNPAYTGRTPAEQLLGNENAETGLRNAAEDAANVAALLAARGGQPAPVDPNKVKWERYQPSDQQAAPSIDPNKIQWQRYVEPETPWQTFGREIMHEAPPVVGGVVGGALAGGALGAAVPLPGTTFLGAVGGGVAGGYAASKATEAGLGALGVEDAAQREANRQANPLSYYGAHLLSNVFGFSPAQKGVQLGERLISGGISGGLSAGAQAAQGGDVDWRETAAQAGAGALFPRMYSYGQKAEQLGKDFVGSNFGAQNPLRSGAAPATPGVAGNAFGGEPAAGRAPGDIPHGTPGADGAAGIAQAQPRPLDVGGPQDRRGPEDWGKERPAAAPGQGVNVGGIDPDVDAALRQALAPKPVEPYSPQPGALSKTIGAVEAQTPGYSTRLYRAEPTTQAQVPDWIRQGQEESGHAGAQGRWFVQDPAMLDWYHNDIPGASHTVSVDVPKANLEQYRVSNQPLGVQRFSRDPANEFFLPPEMANTRQVLPGSVQTVDAKLKARQAARAPEAPAAPAAEAPRTMAAERAPDDILAGQRPEAGAPRQGFAVGDQVHVEMNGVRMTKEPVRITDIQEHSNGARFYRTENSSVYHPESDIVPLTQAALRAQQVAVTGKTGQSYPLRVLQQGTLREMVDRYRDSRGLPELTNFVRDRINDTAGHLPTYIVPHADLTAAGLGRHAAYFSPKENHVVVSDRINDPQAMGYAVLHEAMHAATYHGVERDPQLKGAIRDVMRDIKLSGAPSQLALRYGLRNEHELVAEAFSNPQFQIFLSKRYLTPATARSLSQRFGNAVRTLWDVMVNAVRQHLGIPANQTSALEAAMRLTEHAMAGTQAHAAGVPAGARGAFPRAPAGAGGAGGVPPGGHPPGGGQPPMQPPAGGPGWIPRRPPIVPATKEGNAQAFKAAWEADNELHKLTTVPAGRAVDYLDRAREAGRTHPELRGKGGERIYKAIETGTYNQLPAKMREAYETATGDLTAEANAIRDEMIQRGKIDKADSLNDPNYVHRIVKNLPDRPRMIDPISGEGRLPGMHDPSSTKAPAFLGAQARDGSRLVISSPEEGHVAIWNNRKASFVDNPKDTPLKSGDRFTYNGKEYTVDRGITDEIEQHAAHIDGSPVRYHQNAFLSAFDYHRQMTQMKAYQDFMQRFKGPDSPFKAYMIDTRTPAGQRQARTRPDWVSSGIPDLQGFVFHPDLAQVLHNNFNPGLGLRDINWLRAVNQFAVRSIFWNPVPHSMNAFAHYLVGRGWDWLPLPQNYWRLAKSTLEGFKSAYTQDKLLQDLNHSGTSLIMSKIDSQRIGENLGTILKTDLKNDPGKWEQFARSWGLGRGIDAVNLIYDKAQNGLWTFSDALMASRVRELEMKGLSREDAIAHARIHMPDYRLPIKFFGSRNLVNVMADKNISIFGRYHMGMLNSLGRMMGDLLGPNATRQQRIDALGNVFALGALAFVVKPILDGLVQKVTDNERAELRPSGPLAPLTAGARFARGESDLGLQNIFSFSPAIKQVVESIWNRDWKGQRIIEPQSSLGQNVGQYLDYTARNLISPYSTFEGTVRPGSTSPGFLSELGQQLTHTKVPTPGQVRGAATGQQILRQEATTRARRPRGLIEYGVQGLPGFR
jgi:hypothetical protein